MLMTLFQPKTSLLDPSDADLAASARDGNPKAFGKLLNRYLPVVFNTLYRMTQNHELSEEMAQEAFVKAYRQLHRYDSTRGSFKSWILRIATNAAISEMRKQSKVVSLNALEEAGHWDETQHQLASAPDDLLTCLARQLSAEEVIQAMGKLDVKYRQALLLRYQNELSYEEVAEALDIPLNTARTWIKRGLEKLKHQVKEMAL
jgi:RNA polymerase sigma-70 factor (ECF subfamily)